MGAQSKLDENGWASLSSLMGAASTEAAWRMGMAQARDLSRTMWGPLAGESKEDSGAARVISSRGFGVARRSARLYAPKSAQPGAPIVAMLHGCLQDSASFAKLTRMDELAYKGGFYVLYPDQSSSANPMQCWNWNAKENHSRVGGEPEALADLVGQAQALCGTKPSMTRLAGFSAGAAAAAAMASLYPELFGSVVLVAGPAPFSAHDLRSALDGMALGPAEGAEMKIGAKAMEAGDRHDGAPRRLPMMVVQGDADQIVHPKNGVGQEFAALALNDALGGGSARARSKESLRDGGSVRMWSAEDGGVLACVVSPSKLGHAWSGGEPSAPYAQEGFDQSALALRFFEASESGIWTSFEPESLAAALWP